jgi:hypothetical protein
MSKPIQLVEIQFDGVNWSDVTIFVQAIRINRGKSRELDRYQAGSASVILDNNQRTFDPNNSASPYYGSITPKKLVRISANSIIQFVGEIDDWNFDFEPNGNNTATAVMTDKFRDLANQTINSRTNSVQLSGARINTILSLPEINWPLAARSVDTGNQTLGADTIAQGTNALTYLQIVEQSEPGSIFISKTGDFVFRDRTVAPSANIPVLADDGSGIKYTRMNVVYGTELLYNEIVLLNEVTGGTAIGNSVASQTAYGILNLTRQNQLQNNQQDTQDIADFFANKFGNPEYRFESVSIFLNELSSVDQNKLLNLELNDVVQIKFTPGNPPTGSQINQYAEVIGVVHETSIPGHTLTLKFATLLSTFLILDDPVFGRLDQNALAW